MPVTWTIQLPYVTPSGNQTLRQHWATRATEQEALSWMIRSALNKQTAIPWARGKRRLTITRHGKRELDQDNLSAGCKTLIDIIKRFHLILDDCPRNCELIFNQAKCGKSDPHMVLMIEDIT
jgi:hypothetical protein